jgi:putative ABC transport system ATP-binding protein
MTLSETTPLTTAPASTSISIEAVDMAVKSGRTRLKILKNINLAIPKGTIQFLMGPSGSGKTTLLSIVGGLLTPTTGKVSLLGEDITKLSSAQLTRFRLHHIGFIFQDFNLFSALTAVENVEVALNLHGVYGRQARQESLSLLEQVGLRKKAKLKPHQLSGGQQQRIAIARALAGKPQLIMADEPTATLDSHNGRLVMDILCRLARNQGCTVLMVTHDSRVLNIADRIAYIEDGVIVDTNADAHTNAFH